MVALSSGVESLLLNGLLCVILLVATVSNSLLLFVFYRRPVLRTVSNRFVINLLVTNLVTCWILVPSMLADNVWRRGWATTNDADPSDEERRQQRQAGPALPCLLLEGAAIGLCVACVLSVVMIGVDQYFAVVDPLRYHAFVKAPTSALMIAVSWIAASAFGVLGGLGANGGCAWYACERLTEPPTAAWPLRVPDGYQLAFAALFVAFAFVAPFGAICRIYLSICSAARQNHKRAARHGSVASCTLGAVVAATPSQEAALLDYASAALREEESVEFDDASASATAIATDAADDDGWRPTPQRTRCATPLARCHGPPSPLKYGDGGGDSPSKWLRHSSTKGSLKSTSSSIVNSLRHRISNASMFRYREETRAARISVLVIVMALFCWLPFTLLLILRTPSVLAHLALPHYVKQMGILSLSSNAVVSPLIFAHRNRRIHRELCRLFRASRRRASFYGAAAAADDSKQPPPRTTTKRAGDGGFACKWREPSCEAPLVDGARPGEKRAPPPDANTAATVAEATTAVAASPPSHSVDRRVSILNRLWRASAKADCERRCQMSRLPEVAFETDTSRSSFSSNASTGSHPRSTSLASVSDVAAEEY